MPKGLKSVALSGLETSLPFWAGIPLRGDDGEFGAEVSRAAGAGFVENEKKTLKRAGSTWVLGWLGANPGYSSWIRFVMA